MSAVKLAESDIAEARMTGDVTAYLRAESAADAALAAQPAYAPALAMRGSILVSLHRFPDARDLAPSILDATPGDPTALGVLGDASLELGDLATAADGLRRARDRRRTGPPRGSGRPVSRSSRATLPRPSPATGRPSPPRPTRASRATPSGSTT